jgi:hypothetical protein
MNCSLQKAPKKFLMTQRLLRRSKKAPRKPRFKSHLFLKASQRLFFFQTAPQLEEASPDSGAESEDLPSPELIPDSPPQASAEGSRLRLRKSFQLLSCSDDEEPLTSFLAQGAS